MDREINVTYSSVAAMEDFLARTAKPKFEGTFSKASLQDFSEINSEAIFNEIKNLVESMKYDLVIQGSDAEIYKKHLCRTVEDGFERDLRENLRKAIEIGVKPFHINAFDPSYEDCFKKKIVFCPEEEPATGWTPNQIDKIVQESGWMLMNQHQFALYCINIIMWLEEFHDFTESEAWKAVASSGYGLDCFKDVNNKTGHGRIGPKYDIINNKKLIKSTSGRYYLTNCDRGSFWGNTITAAREIKPVEMIQWSVPMCVRTIG